MTAMRQQHEGARDELMAAKQRWEQASDAEARVFDELQRTLTTKHFVGKDLMERAQAARDERDAAHEAWKAAQHQWEGK